MQTSESAHSGGCRYVSDSVLRVVSRCTYCTAINHVARHRNLGREAVTVALQTCVHLANVGQLVSAFGGAGPQLDVFQDALAHVGVDRDISHRLEKRHQVVHKLARGDFDEEVLAAILNACVCKLRVC